MKALRIFLNILLSLVAIILIYLSTISGKYEVKRSIEINASANDIINYLSNLETWEEWSYWNLMDSTNELSFGDIRKGDGATYTWTGIETGKGQVEILSVQAGQEMKSMIHFREPFESEMNSDFRLSEGESGTIVEWVNYGEMPFLMRFMAQGMDAAFGTHLEIGLDSVKAKLEKRSMNSSGRILSIEESVMSSVDYYYVFNQIPLDEMGDEIMDESFQILMEYLAEDLENITGPPFSITEEWDREANRTSFRVCIPVDSDLPGNDIVLKDRSYEGKVIKAVYQGPFEGIEMTYNAIQAKIVEEGYETAGEPIETYLTDPDLEPNPSKWITEVSWPVK